MIMMIMMMMATLRGRIKHNIAVSQQSSIALPTICFKGRAATMMSMMMIINIMMVAIFKIMMIVIDL